MADSTMHKQPVCVQVRVEEYRSTIARLTRQLEAAELALQVRQEMHPQYHIPCKYEAAAACFEHLSFTACYQMHRKVVQSPHAVEHHV